MHEIVNYSSEQATHVHAPLPLSSLIGTCKKGDLV